jgi:thiol-disulfide isomerase/thioredoxin
MKTTRIAAALVASSFLLLAGAVAQQPTETAKAPSTQPAKPKLYDEDADAKAQIAAALAKAKKENRRVLIQWGGNWCGWCIKLHELCQKDPELKRKLQYEYDVVHVDAGRDGKNMDLAKSYGAACEKEGFPYLTILDADGTAIANQGTPEFEVDGKSLAAGHDAKKVLAFLTKHQAAYADAQKLVDDAVAAAKKDGKQVFLHFGAPWCGWCHKMDDWMARPEIAAILAKDFIDLKIDTDRTIGGKELNEKMAGPKGGGIPWFAILECCGKVVADSNIPGGGNAGFPYQKDEIAHFGAMLKKAAVHMTPSDIETLTASLTAIREKEEKERAAR